MSCGIGHRKDSHLALLWLWHRPAASADSTSSLGNSICHKCGRKKKKKPEKNGWSWQEVRVLVKQGFFGIWNGYTAMKLGGKDFKTSSLQLAAAIRYCFENGWWYPWVWYSSKIQLLNDAVMYLKPHLQWPPSSTLDAWTIVTLIFEWSYMSSVDTEGWRDGWIMTPN